ncbi:MAG: hypothetical protein MZV70_74430 [Desulfobacterales bacterium]|nr:hypothetical protein [Desulfobacterales bacterium]
MTAMARRPGRAEAQLALFEDHGAVAEDEFEQAVQHRRSVHEPMCALSGQYRRHRRARLPEVTRGGSRLNCSDVLSRE